jgi:N-acetylglucosamine kinase-like BadF-type ATPase
VSVTVGVDIGGSGLRLRCSYAGRSGPVLYAPGARVAAGGIDVPALALDARRLLDEAGVSVPDAVCWSMRGLLFLADPADVVRAVRDTLRGRRTAVVSDAVASLVGAIGRLSPGAVVAAGTGAVAFGTDFGQRWTRIDGWGHVLGDRGSGAWVGIEGLRAALRHRDGVDGGSAVLLESAERIFGPAEGWPRRAMTGTDTPDLLARFAPAVSAAATSDPVAGAICVEAGASLAASLLAASNNLESAVLIATGGLLASEPIRDALGKAVSDADRTLSAPRGGALDGSLALAGHLLETGALPSHSAYVHVA